MKACKRDIDDDYRNHITAIFPHINFHHSRGRMDIRHLPWVKRPRSGYRSAPKPKRRHKAMQTLPKIATDSSNTFQRHATTPITTSAKPTSMKHEHTPWQLFKRRPKATAFSWTSALWSSSASPVGVSTHGTTALRLNNDTRRMPMSRPAG